MKQLIEQEIDNAAKALYDVNTNAIYEVGIRSVYSMCAKAFKEGSNWTQKQLKPEWISVSDRLPEQLRDVTVCHVSDKWQGAMFHNGQRWVNSLDSDAWPNNPTHWTELIPLPEPPNDLERIR